MSFTMKRWPIARMLIGLFALVCFEGCDNNPLQIVPVSGVISFDGNQCPRDGAIYFAPLESAEGLPKRTGFGKFDRDGKFTVTSFRPGDGLIPGKYIIWIECLKQPISPSLPQGISFIADEYEWPELTVEPGTTKAIKVNYDVPGRNE